MNEVGLRSESEGVILLRWKAYQGGFRRIACHCQHAVEVCDHECVVKSVSGLCDYFFNSGNVQLIVPRYRRGRVLYLDWSFDKW